MNAAAFAPLALGPRGPRVVAHQLVDALEDHLAVVARHVQHALVARQGLAVALDDGVHELAEPHAVKGSFQPEHKTLHVVVVMVVGVAGGPVIVSLVARQRPVRIRGRGRG